MTQMGADRSLTMWVIIVNRVSASLSAFICQICGSYFRIQGKEGKLRKCRARERFSNSTISNY